MKQKTCKNKLCKKKFTPVKFAQCVCDWSCAIEYNLQNKAKEGAIKRKIERAERVKKLSALKSINDLIKEAQTAFNAFIRERDKNELCICCDKPYGTNHLGGDFDCGHFRSRGAAGHLRFNEDNAFGQRKYCNTYLSGNVQGMRAGMIKRIGIERVDAVENNNEVHKWTKEELIAIKNEYKLKLKQLRLNENNA